MNPWKRIKVIVEVPVQDHPNHSFTAKDLAWAVDRALSADGFWQDRKYLPTELRPRFGKVLVKQYNKVIARSMA